MNIDPENERHGGLSGTRVSVEPLFDWLETESLDEFVKNFPSVSRGWVILVLHLDGNLLIKSSLRPST